MDLYNAVKVNYGEENVTVQDLESIAVNGFRVFEIDVSLGDLGTLLAQTIALAVLNRLNQMYDYEG